MMRFQILLSKVFPVCSSCFHMARLSWGWWQLLLPVGRASHPYLCVCLLTPFVHVILHGHVACAALPVEFCLCLESWEAVVCGRYSKGASQYPSSLRVWALSLSSSSILLWSVVKGLGEGNRRWRTKQTGGSVCGLSPLFCSVARNPAQGPDTPIVLGL